MATFRRGVVSSRRATNVKTRRGPRVSDDTQPSLRESVQGYGSRHLTIWQLLGRDGENCYLCGNHLEVDRFEVEHIIPRVRGGGDELSNLALACKRCNRAKHGLIVSFRVSDRKAVFTLD